MCICIYRYRQLRDVHGRNKRVATTRIIHYNNNHDKSSNVHYMAAPRTSSANKPRLYIILYIYTYIWPNNS